MRYKLLGNSGLRVSELSWALWHSVKSGVGERRKAVICKMFDAFREAGGNFIDSADYYVGGKSEEIVGKCIASDRDRLRAFDDLVRVGKVLYVGISDMPAWVISQANTLATLWG